MLDADGLAAVRIGPARNIARSQDRRIAGFQTGVHRHAAVDGKSRRLGQLNARAHAHTGDHQIGF
jgi:hypothetical protein